MLWMVAAISLMEEAVSFMFAASSEPVWESMSVSLRMDKTKRLIFSTVKFK
jgi:hypothetical protein